jgi:hypothetical protein
MLSLSLRHGRGTDLNSSAWEVQQVCVQFVWGGRTLLCLTFACTCAHVLMCTCPCALAYAHVPQVSASRFEDNALSSTCGSSQETRGPRVWAVGVMVAMGRAVWIVACVCLHLLSLSILAVGLAVRVCLFVCLHMHACRYMCMHIYTCVYVTPFAHSYRKCSRQYVFSTFCSLSIYP